MRKHFAMVFDWVRRHARWFGAAATLAGTVFVAFKIYDQRDIVFSWRPTTWQVFGILATAVVYGMTSRILGRGWLMLLYMLGCEGLEKSDVYRVYARSQIAKYVPGNVFHFVSRHVMLHGDHAGHRILAAASVCEVAGVVVGALTVGLSAYLWQGFTGLGGVFIAVILLSGLTMLCGGGLFKTSVVIMRSRSSGCLGCEYDGRLRYAIGAMVCYVVFFLVSGALFWSVLSLIAMKSYGYIISTVISVYTFSWVIGFIVPGAPGGLGVREATLLALSKTWPIVSGDVVLAVLCFRFVTMVGDVIFFASSYLPCFQNNDAVNPV